MPQIKIYGLKNNLDKIKIELSTIIHNCVIKILCFPKEKKYHRFISFNEDDMIFPDTKSDSYIIIEILMIAGREVETKKALIKELFEQIHKGLDISKIDIEMYFRKSCF